MTNQEARELVATLKAAYPRQELERATVEVYVHHLEPLAHTSAANALEIVLSESRTFPSIAVVLEAYQRAALVHAREVESERRRQEDEELASAERMAWPELLKVMPASSRQWVEEALHQGDIGVEQTTEGECDDCARDGARYKIGVFSVCRRCAERRQRAGG